MRDTPSEWKGRRKSLAIICFLTRLYNYPDTVFTPVAETVDLPGLHKKFYKLFQASFCRNETKVFM